MACLAGDNLSRAPRNGLTFGAMRWEGERRSNNVEDRRGISLRGPAIGGGALIIAVIATLLGAPPGLIRALLGGGTTEQQTSRQPSPAEEKAADFVKVILASTEDVWTAVLPAEGRNYEAPKLVLFTDLVESACGTTSAAVGPFYCPPDRRVYLDLGFFAQLAQRFGAPGDFAQAYVVAHEVGHHVQNLLGISSKVAAARNEVSRTEANRISVRTELQADCLAGVWAFHANQTRHLLEPGDVEEGLRAAAAIGDDTLQNAAQGRIVPESFTHGTSAQRVHWFKTGMNGGRVRDCDTFSAASL
jgi:predicted metalloprotease